MSEVTTLGTVNRAPLLASFIEATCSKLTCRGCNEDLLNAVVCCEVDDDTGKKVEHVVHTICETCFDARVHMQRPGSVDKCRFCVEDKKTNQRLIVGDPKKRRAKNQAFNELAMEARKLVEGEEEIRRKELAIERAPIEAQRHAAAQAAREKKRAEDSDATDRARDALEKERKAFEEAQRIATDKARERDAALEEQRAAAAARAEYEAQKVKEAAEREAKEAQKVREDAKREAQKVKEAAEHEAQTLKEAAEREAQKVKEAAERGAKPRKRVLDPEVAQQRSIKAKETRELKKAKIAGYEKMSLKVARMDRIVEIAKTFIAAADGNVEAFMEAVNEGVLDVD